MHGIFFEDFFFFSFCLVDEILANNFCLLIVFVSKHCTLMWDCDTVELY